MSVLSRIISNVRLQANESLTDAKYTDTDLVDLIRQCWPQIVEELNRLASNPIIVRHTISIKANQATYIMPPHIGEILWLARIDTTTGLISWEVRPRSLWNPYGPRVTWEGNIMTLQPVFQQAVDLQLWYIPDGDISPVVGTVDTWTASLKQLTLSGAATTGTFDKRTNAYAGYLVEVVDANEGGTTEELIVTSSSVTTAGKTVLILPLEFAGFTPFSGDVIELVPFGMTRRLELVISLYCASILLSYESDANAVQLIERQYSRVMRGLRMEATRFEGRVGKYFDRQTPENQRYGFQWTW